MKHGLFITALFLFAACQNVSKQALDSTLQDLDRTVAEKRTFEREKEETIQAIKKQLFSCEETRVRYDIYQQLYQQYSNYHIDSAIHYAKRKALLADSLHDLKLVVASEMELAGVYTNAGMYAEAIDIVTRFGDESRSQDLVYFYHICHSLSAGLYQNSKGSDLTDLYHTRLDHYRDSLISVLGKEDISSTFVESEKLIDHKAYDQAIAMLERRYKSPETNNREKAILDYSLAVAFLGKGNRESAKLHYAQSAITDLRTPVKEYKSLQELALLLYQDGDYNRAYQYIMCSMEDVIGSNTRIRSQAVAPILPVITQAYEEQARRRKIQLTIALISVAALLSFALVMIGIVSKQNRNIRLSSEKINNINNDLIASNAELKMMTNRLLDSNCIKDEYVTRYMELSSEYIDNLEKYRLSLLRIARSKSSKEVVAAIQVPLDLDDVLKDFYANFDQTFMHLFPGFVDEVNALLKENEQLSPKSGKLLNTELRLLALIRLGVSDSVKIARFLRCSLSTVYNYRTKLRNAAIDSRDDFESKVVSIGQIIIS